MKYVLSGMLVWVLALSACQTHAPTDETPSTETTSTAPKSNFDFTGDAVMPAAGSVDGGLVVIADHLYKNYSDTILQSLQVPYLVLPRLQFRHNFSSIPHQALSRTMKRQGNLVLILSPKQSSERELIESLVPASLYTEIENGATGPFYLKNVWAKPQGIVLYVVQDENQLLGDLKQEASAIADMLALSDRPDYLDILYAKGHKQDLSKQYQEEYGFDLRIPNDFVLAKNETGFQFFRKDFDRCILNLFVYVERVNDTEISNDLCIGIRNKLGKHVHSDVEGSFMTTDTVYYPIQTEWDAFGLPAIESRGLWAMVGEFMGGPFLSYCISYPEKQQIIYLEGFMYGPGVENKRYYMRQVETIFSTFAKVK